MTIFNQISTVIQEKNAKPDKNPIVHKLIVGCVSSLNPGEPFEQPSLSRLSL